MTGLFYTQIWKGVDAAQSPATVWKSLQKIFKEAEQGK